MKQYKEITEGYFTLENTTIPADMRNRSYQNLLAEVKAGDAEIISYSKPVNVNDKVEKDIRELKNEQVIDAMIDFMDGKPGKFQAFKSQLDNLKNKIK